MNGESVFVDMRHRKLRCRRGALDVGGYPILSDDYE